MTGGRLAGWHQLTLVRHSHPSLPGVMTRRLTGLSHLPVWAGPENRVDLDLRQVAEAACDGSTLVSHEVHAWLAGEAEAAPAMALLDASQPVVAVLLDDRALVVVELIQGGLAGRKRFRALCKAVESLRCAGFPLLVDHATGGPIPVTAAAIAERLGVAERDRTSTETWLDVQAGAAVGAALGVVMATSFVFRAGIGPVPAMATVAGAGLVAGIIVSLSASCHEWWERVTHLRRFRASLLPDQTDVPTQHFVADPSWWQELAATVVFGGMMWLSLRNGEYLPAVGFAAVLAVAFGYSFAVRGASVELDDAGLTGLTVRGRRRIAFRDIDWISSTADPEPRVVGSVEHGRIWISRHVDEGEHLLERIWAATCAANTSGGDAIARDDVARQAALVDDVRRRVGAGRLTVDDDITRHGARRPLWLQLLRPHPLRQQFRWQRRLLERGHVVLAHVLSPHWLLAERSADHQGADAYAIVVFSTNRSWRGGVSACDQIMACLQSQQAREGDDEEDDAPKGAPPEPLPEDATKFAQALQSNAGHPLMVPVPATLGGGRGVFCTTLIVVRRHLPLGSLASWWLPLLVDPVVCRYSMVVPLRYWPPAVRRVWKAGPLAVDDSHA